MEEFTATLPIWNVSSIYLVKKELQKLPGVDVEEVRIGGATLLVDETRTDEEKISDAIAAAGYVLARTAS